jgi:acyl dehydratase
MVGKTIDELRAGDRAEITRVVGEDDVIDFVEAVGDYNPVHSDPVYAAGTVFKTPIAPGIYTAGLISAVIGTTLPGPGAIYLSQTLKFIKPVRAGDAITARVEVLDVVHDRNRIRLHTVCVNQHGEDVLSGEAWVMPSRTSVVYEKRRAGASVVPGWPLSSWTWATQAMLAWSALGLAMLQAAGRCGAPLTSAGRR